METVFLIINEEKHRYEDMYDGENSKFHFSAATQAVKFLGSEGYWYCGELSLGMTATVLVFQKQKGGLR